MLTVKAYILLRIEDLKHELDASSGTEAKVLQGKIDELAALLFEITTHHITVLK